MSSETTVSSETTTPAKARTPRKTAPKTTAAKKPAGSKTKKAAPTTAKKSAPKKTSQPAGTPTVRDGSMLHAAMAVLKTSREPLTVGEIYERAVKRNLLTNVKTKTPIASLSARLAVANKHGEHVERPAPGRYQLRK
jgi:hypothetical protein